MVGKQITLAVTAIHRILDESTVKAVLYLDNTDNFKEIIANCLLK